MRRACSYAVASILASLAASAWGQIEPICSRSLRFHGNGYGDIDRVKIRIDDPNNSLPGPPADVSATDFTIEFWMKALAAENQAPAVQCGNNINWIYGNIVFDRDRYNQDRKYGVSIAGGRIVFGISGDGTGDRTVCSDISVLNGSWRHVAVQRRRSDGRMWIWVDGRLSAEGDGPDGDVSYPDNGVPGNFCNGPCVNSDPFLVIGAEKHDAGPAYPSYSGWLTEVRLSDVLRYEAPFVPAWYSWYPDAHTMARYRMVCDWKDPDFVRDDSQAPGGPSHGERHYGGNPAGPEWHWDGVTDAEPLISTTSAPRLVAFPGSASRETRFVAYFDPSHSGPVRLSIFDIAGRELAELVSPIIDGRANFTWNRVAKQGRSAPRGIYLAKIVGPSGNSEAVTKFLVR